MSDAQDPVEVITSGLHVDISETATQAPLEPVSLSDHLSSLVEDVRRAGPASRSRSLAITALEEASWRLWQAEQSDATQSREEESD